MTQNADYVRARDIAVAFMSAPMTERLRIASELDVADDLPESNNDASFVILRRIRNRSLVADLARLLGVHNDGSGA